MLSIWFGNISKTKQNYDNTGKKVTKDKYVGDVLAANGTNIENIREKTKRGMGLLMKLFQAWVRSPLALTGSQWA